MKCQRRRILIHESKIILLTWALVLISSQFKLAQQTVTSATLGGRVEDAGGAVVNGAKARVESKLIRKEES
jgi:hypothetical protein